MNDFWISARNTSRIFLAALAATVAAIQFAPSVKNANLSSQSNDLISDQIRLTLPTPETADISPEYSASLNESAGLDMMATGGVPSAVFGSVALPFSNLPTAARWRQVNVAMVTRSNSKCGSDTACAARHDLLTKAVERARNSGFVAKLQTINSAVNAMVKYSSDRNFYGKMDYWATAPETLRAGVGDCEDYAILKLAALRAAGIPANSMSLTILRDRKRNLFHAVLVVSTNQGHYVLDNVTNKVLPDTRIAHYQPLYTFGQQRSWIHGVRRGEGAIASAASPAFNKVMPGLGPEEVDVPTLGNSSSMQLWNIMAYSSGA